MHTISSPVTQSRPARAFTIWCLAAAALVAGLNVSSPRLGLNFIDGRYFYLAARMFIRGESPYDLERFRQQLRETARQSPQAGDELRADLESYAYPPASLIVYAPLGLLDYPVAKQVFSILNVLLMPIAAWMMMVFFDGAAAARQRALTIGALIVGMLHFSFPVTIVLGQSGIVLLLALAGTLLAIERRSVFLAAVCAAIAAIKPQLTVLPILAIIARERAWREGAIVLCAVALSNLAAMLFIHHPGLLREMIDAVIQNRSLEVNQAQSSSGGLFLGARSSVLAAANLLLIPGGAIAVLLAARKREHYPKHTAVVASILLALYAMPVHYYDFVLLLAALLGCLTVSLTLGALLMVLAIGIDREILTQAILSGIPGASGLTHQTLHAVYVLIAFVAFQGYVFVRAFRGRSGALT